MGICKLSKEIALKIAAGEVVERPVSVVKEAIENSLDAEASRILITLMEGGKTSIVVEDDGVGITWEDMSLLLTRYATSKISSLEDLSHIGTLGYRGEALASIASVSCIDIRSKARGAEIGGFLQAEGGTITCLDQLPWKEGTRVQVENLFFNFPARKKFLRSSLAELKRISTVVRDYAVAYPSVSFSLYHKGNKTFESLGNGERIKVLQSLWGLAPEIRSTVVQCGSVSLECWWQSTPGRQRNSITTFVNGRSVSDPLIKGAASVACKDLSGNWMLFFSLPADLVDVNIHPAKAEIRFRYPSEIFEVVKAAGQDLQSRATKLFVFPDYPAMLGEDNKRDVPLPHSYTPCMLAPDNFFTRVSSPGDVLKIKTGSDSSISSLSSDDVETERKFLDDFSSRSQVRFISQMASGYLLFEHNGALTLMDPHAAHERVKYEEIVRQIAEHGVVSQKLAPSLPIPPSLATDATEYLDKLREAGFSFETENGQLLLSSAPDLQIEGGSGPLFLLRTAILMWQETGSRSIDDVLWRKWATAACKKAVKITTRCSPQEALHLWASLHLCSNPAVCPHGRPTTLTLEELQIEQYFGREK